MSDGSSMPREKGNTLHTCNTDSRFLPEPGKRGCPRKVKGGKRMKEELENKENIYRDGENPMQDVKGGRSSAMEVREILPCVPLRGATIFPHTVVHFDIGREKSIRALERAMATDKILFVSTQKDDSVLIPSISDMYEIGTVVRVRQMLKIKGDAVRVLVEGICRATADECITEANYISCTITRFSEEVKEEDLTVVDRARLRLLNSAFTEYVRLTSRVSEEVADRILSMEDPAFLVDNMANEIAVSRENKQRILDAVNFSDRLNVILEVISEENEIVVVERELAQKVKENIDTGQREYYLREKIKAIESELGVEEDVAEETAEWLEKLDGLKLDEKTDTKIRKEINKYAKMMPSSAESAVSRNYIETLLDLPWHKESKQNYNLKKAEKILNEDHYGLIKVKQRILEYLAVNHLSKAIRGPILCLVGPPGVGKTSVAKSIARATGREFVRMSLGGVRDEAEIRGHRRTYIGAIPGRVINAILECGVKNPLFLFDEVDKIGNDFRGDPASALLEVLDPEQNSTFTDHFLEVPFDLSRVMFITTANTKDTIPEPLLDRMEIIELPGYTEEEKVKIAETYLIPKQVKENGLKKENLRISEKALHDIVNYYTRESGVRNLEREIANVCRKTAWKVVAEKHSTCSVTPRNLESYLGKHKFSYDPASKEDRVGVTTGLAWTAVGGVTLEVECAVLPGTGQINLTGKLGDVMQESAKTAISYVRSVTDEYGIDPEFYKTKDLHVHIPEGAVPKDGPSAGVTMVTSVVSALTGIPVRRDVAMTGEVTLRGTVIPIGGLREKALAAHRAGIRKVLIPRENLPDLEEIPKSVRREMEFLPMDNAGQVLAEALASAPVPAKKTGSVKSGGRADVKNKKRRNSGGSRETGTVSEG